MSFGTKVKGDKGEPAWANLIEGALGDGNPAQSASYVIFKDGSTYKARNGTDGTIDYSGTNAATVINAAIDAAPLCGTVYAQGQTTLIDPITVDAQKSFVFNRIIISDTNDDGIVVDGGATATDMKNFLIGNYIQFPASYAKSAVKLRNCKLVYVNIRQIFVQTGLGTGNSVGIHLLADGSGTLFNTVVAQNIGGLETGIRLESTSGTDYCTANKIYNADITFVVDGVKQVNGGLNTSGNTFLGISVTGIGNGDTGFTNVDEDNQYISCRTIDASGTAVDFSNSASGKMFMLGCQISNSNVANSGTIEHHGCTYAGNILENAGAAAAVADGGTIAHGLATTPTWATATGSVASEIITVTAIGAANITVAIKTDAGAAGTSQTIYWRAKKEL